MDKEKLHTWEFQLKGISRNMRCKLLQKRYTGKTTECSKHLRLITIEKNIFSELNRCIFQISVKYIDLISLKYIDLVIPKIFFILVLCNFNFYFKTMWLPPTKLPPYNNIPPPPKQKFLTPIWQSFTPSPKLRRCMPKLCQSTIIACTDTKNRQRNIIYPHSVISALYI